MKKNKFLKMFLTFICILAISIVSDHVYGYQLKFKAKAGEGKVYFLSMGNAFGDPPTTANFTSSSEQLNLTKEGVYQTYKFMIQSEPMTVYGESGKYKINYAASKDIITVDNYDNYNSYDYKTVKNHWVIGKKDNITTDEVARKVDTGSEYNVSVYKEGAFEKQDKIQKNDDSRFILYQQRAIEGPSDSNQKVMISKWQLDYNTLYNMVKSDANFIKNGKNNQKYVYFSLPCILNNGNYDYLTYTDGSLSYVKLNTAYDAVCGFNMNEYAYPITAYDFGGYTKTEHIIPSSGAQSIINLYDNELYLPDEMQEPQEVYVRHVECDENGNIKKNPDGTPKLLDIANSSEIKISNNIESILDNSPDKISNKNKYQEYYKILVEDQLRVSRSLTIASNSIIYDYKGYSVSSADTLSNAERQDSTRVGEATSVNVSALKDSATDQYKKTATIVTLKYCPKPSDDETKPNGGVETLKSGNSTENCQLVYTPTNADIKPYLIANKIKLKDLKYEYEKEGNNIKYSMSIFNIKKLVSGSISDNEDYINNDTGELQGQIFGNEDEKWTLLNGNSPQKFYFTNDVDSLSKTFKNNYKDTLPTLSQLKNELINKKTNKSDFSDTFKVPENRYNGLRIPKLIANYEEYDVMTPSNSSKTPSVDYTSNTIKVIVYNPITVKPPTIKSEGVVDHSTTTEQNTSVIQKNADFELTLEKSDAAFYSSIKDSEYLDRYYLIFDIDIVKTDKTSYNKLYTVDRNNLTEINTGDDVIHRGTLIELDKGATTFNAKASNNVNTGDIISQNKSNITLIGVSNNMPRDLLLKEVLYYQKLNTLNSIKNDVYISSGSNYNYTINGSLESVQKEYCDASVKYTDYKVHDEEYYGRKIMYGDAYYFAKAVKEITNVGRIYDFKITDCSDIDYKKVFRETKDNGVNNLKGIVYFSGIKELKIYSNDVNTLEDRTDISISNSVSKRILPLGPYKNTYTSYVNAPKMGYRISFDLKTSGYYKYTAENAITSTREINITPSYYYISKDGQTFNNNINLYYKNSSGKYVKFDGSDYTIYFKPKDGYRSIYNATAGIDDDSIMSDQLEPLEIGSSDGFTLNYKMMSTSGTNFLQAWYGEFKLPNSTIAVEGNNLSKPLTDGYIGVIFDIQCIDNKGTSNEKRLRYNQNNKNANPNTNTTQWDYEGFLGFSNPGSKSGDISIQLEKGTWIVNDDNVLPKAKYIDIKGTVALFDIDNRAANDFD